jgi:hypothetical protein
MQKCGSQKKLKLVSLQLQSQADTTLRVANEVTSQIVTLSLLFTSYPIRYSLTILLFDAIWSGL